MIFGDSAGKDNFFAYIRIMDLLHW